ncbi:MAG: sialate O-acetylesterase [Pirellulaceae bacterium]
MLQRSRNIPTGLVALLLGLSAIFGASLSARAAEPIKVFILAGQSNMEGKAKVSLIETQLVDPKTAPLFQHLKTDSGEWVVRDDVWIKFLGRKGGLTVGYGSPERIGPELEFGNTVGDAYGQQVLLIKTAWGGKSLYRDFRPPSSGLPDKAVLEDLLQKAQKRNPDATMDDIKASFGFYYREMLKEVRDTLANLKEFFPEYQGQGYELAGLVWFQGWNDMINDDYTAEYAENMANFIRDARKDLDAAKLPVVIGQLGVGGEKEDKPNPKRDAFKEAQIKPASLAEFQGNVAVVKTDQYWDMEADAVFRKGWKENLEQWNKVGSDYPFHYLGSAKCYSRIGKAFGEAMLKLQQDAK